MKLPSPNLHLPPWPPMKLQVWKALAAKVDATGQKVGHGNAFEQMLETLRAHINKASIPRELFQKRLGARALSWLWLHDHHEDRKVFSSKWLTALFEGQQPRVSRLTLLQLLSLYFKYFDRFDDHGTFRETLEKNLLIELQKAHHLRRSGSRHGDPLTELRNRPELLRLDGPARLAQHCMSEHRDLASELQALGLGEIINGRYGDVCRAQFYLQRLRSIPEGEHDPVLDEIQKPEVHLAPFEDKRTIGLAALEIVIDRSGEQASECWQAFILKLAGDPRLPSDSIRYQQWWRPLGEERIRKVRAWLSRLDLRLFLQAVELYGKRSGKADLQRMFPARKRFMEGLLDLHLVRSSRLFLGRSIRQDILRSLDDKTLANGIGRLADRTDTAVIYLDCGQFHLIEGSHSFKLWAYMAKPAAWVDNLHIEEATFHQLTSKLRDGYLRDDPRRPCIDIVHRPGTWQNALFSFLGQQGVSLDIEKLLSVEDYQYQKRVHGIPEVFPEGQRSSPGQQTTSRHSHAQYRTHSTQRN